ncbi:hypothetical protein VOLCADRAFT_94143 [Volvox carteri f. nagariensis]|uniref:Uncharacterized protein n=1 Tax=Volvox carteri f. nagariensis TaxID=3068 RepID=D8U494_VOLCA|nr:uncharacterized protein VOLCADRAFT_94143 [Volvox carteri f. nagariensis]EFJ45363.1 hypothetical protein VOLCADRAFT_94143 [Volvox carteri f. nagariensis]|eukprot:XP_002953390.1 hypothetical protein VOLCADRAFT_94143 [Volvox carteri f. nagariensis]
MSNATPKAINATRMGVGACVWEGELFLAAYLGGLPTYRYVGCRVVELGAGPGLVGILLAKMGAKVHITDIAKVLPLIDANIEANGVGLKQRRGAAEGYAVSEELEWGKEGYDHVVARLASEPVDWCLAADCCYIDQASAGTCGDRHVAVGLLGLCRPRWGRGEGTSPSTPHFVRTCALLCGPITRCLVCFELRSSEVQRVFVEEASKAFAKVERLQPHSLPKPCQVEHILLYELSGSKLRT